MNDMLDENGQPIPPHNAKRVGKRTVDELTGICKGLLADGVLNNHEIAYLYRWIEENLGVTDSWIVRRLWKRVDAILDDGVVEDDEREDLFNLLEKFIGDHSLLKKTHGLSTTLPLDASPPRLIFPDRIFCFIGAFVFGPRRTCEEEVVKRGGEISKSVTKKLDYLVIGTIDSRDWLHSTYGNKIKKAVNYRDEGQGIAIVGEDHWASFIVREHLYQ